MSDSEGEDFPPPPPEVEEEEESELKITKEPVDYNLDVESEEKGDDNNNEDENDDGSNMVEDEANEDNDEDNDNNEDEEPEEEEDDAEDAPGQKKRKKSTTKRPSKKRKGLNFFQDEADVAEDSDEEEEEDTDRIPGEQVLDKDALAAIEAVESRHRANRDYISRSADEIAEEIERRHRIDAKMKQRYEQSDGLGLNQMGSRAIAQQSLLPSVKDPKIYRIKCKPGNEQIAVRSILLKSIDVKNRTGVLKIKSAFCSSSKGVVYVEAISEAFAKDLLKGLTVVYQGPTSFAQIPIPEMTSVLNVTIKKKPLKEGQWVRLKRGPLKGDLARIISLHEGGSKAFVQAVPRPDYTLITLEDGRKKTPKSTSKVRPQQRLFDPEEARENQHDILRRHHPLDNSITPYDMWNNDYYKDGFLFKELTVAVHIDDQDVNPRLEELQLFRQKKRKNADGDYDDDEEDEDLEPDVQSSALGSANGGSFIRELAEQIKSLGEEEEKEGMNPFLPGDLVQVTSGDLKNLVARVLEVNDATRIARIIPYNHELTTEMSMEVDLLVKYIFPGAHVKVVGGRFMGQTGRVVSVSNKDGDFIAAILTDVINSEIQCSVKHLQMSSEVTTGLGNLMGYELYDLVTISENESAVVIAVGAEKLRVINHLDQVKEFFPQELHGKRNFQSQRAKGFDLQQNSIAVGDTVNVTAGPHSKLTGTIKHLLKGTVWLHSNSYLKNSGIFTVKARNCVVAGGKTSTPTLSANYKGVLLPTPVHTSSQGSPGVNSVTSVSTGRSGASGRGPNRNDASVGITVKITKGGFKGLFGQVVDATPTHYSVELLAKLKTIVIARQNAIPIGDKGGSYQKEAQRSVGFNRNDVGISQGASTPFLTADTPQNFGSETPAYGMGSETPIYGSETPAGSRTPSDIWHVNPVDLELQERKRREEEEKRQKDMSDHSFTTDTPTTNYSQSDFGTGRSQSRDNRAFDTSLTSNRFNSTSGGSAVGSRSNPVGSGYEGSNYGGNASQGSVPTNQAARGSNSSVSRASGLESVVSYRDWEPNWVVRTKDSSQLYVIQQPMDNMGMFQVCVRERNGNLGSGMAFHFEDLSLAVPSKKAKVKVLSGQFEKRIGELVTIVRSDGLIKFSIKEKSLIKLNNFVWVN